MESIAASCVSWYLSYFLASAIPQIYSTHGHGLWRWWWILLSFMREYILMPGISGVSLVNIPLASSGVTAINIILRTHWRNIREMERFLGFSLHLTISCFLADPYAAEPSNNYIFLFQEPANNILILSRKEETGFARIFVKMFKWFLLIFFLSLVVSQITCLHMETTNYHSQSGLASRTL